MTDPTDTPTDVRTDAARLAGQALAALERLNRPVLADQFAERAQLAALTSIALSLAALALPPTGPVLPSTPAPFSWGTR